MAGKGSQRRKCLISREEESLRYDLAFGKITFEEWVTGMDDIDAKANPHGVCGQCLDGLMTDTGCDYSITCRIDSTIHHQWCPSCSKFRKEE